MKEKIDRTIGECLRNNWNSINESKEEERKLRIYIQNNFSNKGEFDKKYYLKNLWNYNKK